MAIWQFMRYSLVGLLNTAIGVSFITLGAYLGWHYVLYTLLGYCIAFIVSFALNFKFTFRTQGRTVNRALRFVCFNLINLALVQALQAVLIEQIHIQEYIAVGLAMVFYTVLGFFMNKKFVFNG